MIQEKIQVEIFGRTYDLDIEGLTEIEANALAALVTERMLEQQRTTRVVDTSRLAVLAALNFADELRRLESKHSNFVEATEQRIQTIKKILQATLK